MKWGHRLIRRGMPKALFRIVRREDVVVFPEVVRSATQKVSCVRERGRGVRQLRMGKQGSGTFGIAECSPSHSGVGIPGMEGRAFRNEGLVPEVRRVTASAPVALARPPHREPP